MQVNDTWTYGVTDEYMSHIKSRTVRMAGAGKDMSLVSFWCKSVIFTVGVGDDH